MRNITSIMKVWLVVLAVLSSASAKAQFQTSLSQQVNTTYEPVNAEFKLSEVAAALATDTTTLAAALEAWYLADEGNYLNPDTYLFGIPTDTLEAGIQTGYNADGRGSYWMNLDGSLGAWGENQVYNSILSWSTAPADDYLVIPVGHYPNTVGTATMNFVMQFNGKKATFTINYEITPLPEAPEAELDLNKINKVGMVECETRRYASNGYETTPVKVAVPDMASALGMDKAKLAEVFAQDVYVAFCDVEMGFKVDSLQLLTKTDGWLMQVCENWDGAAGDMTPEVCGAAYSGNDSYFIQQMSYNAEVDSVSFIMGQMPSKLAVGDSLYCDLHVMNGDKAYIIRHHLYIIEEPKGEGFEDMTEVGVQYITVESYPTNDYASYKIITPNLDEAASLLNCNVENLSLKAIASNGGFANNTTANNGGWWFNKAGFVCSWGAGESGSYFFIEPATASDYSQLHFGQFPDDYAPGDSAVTDLYLVYGAAYYRLHIRMDIVAEPEIGWEHWENVATRTVTVQGLAVGDYNWSDASLALTNQEMQDLLGTTSPVLYANSSETEYASTNCPYSKKYSITESPGFWMDANAVNVGWGSSVWGISSSVNTLPDGYALSCMYMGGAEVGTVYNGKLYLVNESNNKMVTLNVIYKIVSEISQTEEVGSCAISLPMSMDEFEVQFGLDSIAEALGYDNVDDLADAYVLRAMMENGSMTEATTPGNGVVLDAEGYANDNGDFTIYFENGYVFTTANEDPEEGWTKVVQLFFIHPDTGKQYTVNITLMTGDAYQDYITAVSSVKASATATSMFDLSGRKVEKAVKGVYIMNGKKVVK